MVCGKMQPVVTPSKWLHLRKVRKTLHFVVPRIPKFTPLSQDWYAFMLSDTVRVPLLAGVANLYRINFQCRTIIVCILYIGSCTQARSQWVARGATHPQICQRSTFSHKMGKNGFFVRRLRGVRYKRSTLWVQKVHFFGIYTPQSILAKGLVSPKKETIHVKFVISTKLVRQKSQLGEQNTCLFKSDKFWDFPWWLKMSKVGQKQPYFKWAPF